jgi:alcohol dehydrogenase (cytochrome c)
MTQATLVSALLTTVLTAVPIAAFAQTADDLKNDEKTTGNVLVYGMGYSGNRYSPLAKITKDNVGKLVPVWSYSRGVLTDGEAEAQPESSNHSGRLSRLSAIEH